MLAKFAVGTDILLHLQLAPHYPLLLRLLAAGLDLHYFQVFRGDWDLDVVGGSIFPNAVVANEEDVMVFVGAVEDLSLGASCRVSLHFLAMGYQDLLLQLLALSHLFQVVVCGC